MYIIVFVHIPCSRKAYILFGKKKNHSDSPKTFFQTDIIKMLEFLIDNLVAFLCMLTAIPFSSTCSFIRKRYSLYREFYKNEKKLVRSFNFTFRYITI
jgi:hypothetical protein